jgi:hypothetical protein
MSFACFEFNFMAPYPEIPAMVARVPIATLPGSTIASI